MLVSAILGMVVWAGLMDVAGLIAFVLIVLGVWLSIGATCLWALTWLGCKMMRRRVPFRLRTPLKMTAALLLIGVSGSIAAHALARPALLDGAAPTQAQLEYMYSTDQGDRYAARWLTLDARDALRQSVVLGMLDRGELQDPADLYRAATILQHGALPRHYELAYQLARRAADAGYAPAGALWPAAYDRWMVSIGDEPVYGTQFRVELNPFGLTVEQP